MFQDYSTEFLTETQQVMLEDLRDYGLVYQRKVYITAVGIEPLTSQPITG